MFYYKKQFDDEMKQIKPDMKAAVHFKQKGIQQELMCIRWTLLLAFRLGDQKQANWMMQLCVQFLNMAEEMGFLEQVLQGESAMLVDVIDRSNPDMIASALSSGQLFLEASPQLELPPNDYCGALMQLKETCLQRKKELAVLLGMTCDEPYQKQLKKWISIYEEIIADCKKKLSNMTHDGERTFPDDYENERAWELDSGNYFDPKPPLIIESK